MTLSNPVIANTLCTWRSSSHMTKGVFRRERALDTASRALSPALLM